MNVTWEYEQKVYQQYYGASPDSIVREMNERSKDGWEAFSVHYAYSAEPYASKTIVYYKRPVFDREGIIK